MTHVIRLWDIEPAAAGEASEDTIYEKASITPLFSDS